MIICLSCMLTACGYRDLMKQYQQALSGAAINGKGGYLAQENDIQKNNTVTPSSVSGSGESADVDKGENSSGVHSADYVTADMQTSEFWIDRMSTPERILLKTEEIEELNEKIKTQLVSDESAIFYDLDSYGESIDGADLKKLIGKHTFSLTTYYTASSAISPKQWNSYLKNCNLDNIRTSNKIQYGIVCERTDVRSLPSSVMIQSEPDGQDENSDILQNTALAVNEPVLVLYTSRDGNWYYIMAEEYTGWVKKDAIGICEGRSQWEQLRNPKYFLVVTGDRIQIEDSLSGNYEFTMGTKLALAENKEWQDTEDAVSARDNYVVKVPVRTKNGKLSVKYLSIPVSRDVHVGYMDYTQANIVSQAFKMLGNPYGWGGASGERDCSSLIRDIYLCFGFRLPRNSSDMAKIHEKQYVDLSGLSDKEKEAKLYSASPGSILYMPGHVMLYLGCVEKKHFVISAVGGQVQKVTVNDLQESAENGSTWEENLTSMIELQ